MLHGGRAFDYDFIVHVPDDIQIGEIPDGIAEKVTGDGLDDVLNELGAVAFNAAPVLLAVRPHVADGFAAELVYAHLGFCIGEPASGGKPYEQHTGYPFKGDTADG